MKIIGYILLFFVVLIGSFPKDNLIFSLQKELKTKNIYINFKQIEDYSFELFLKDTNVVYNNISFMDASELKAKIFFLYNTIEGKDIKLNFQNIILKKVNLTYTVLAPKKILINGISNVGVIDGNINLLNNHLKIYFINLKNKDIKYFLKHDNKGYFYETYF